MGDTKDDCKDLDNGCLDDDGYEDCILWCRSGCVRRVSVCYLACAAVRRGTEIVDEKTYTIPQGVASVHVLPAAVAMAVVNSVPLTKSQKNFGKKQPQRPAQTTSVGWSGRGLATGGNNGDGRGRERRTD